MGCSIRGAKPDEARAESSAIRRSFCCFHERSSSMRWLICSRSCSRARSCEAWSCSRASARDSCSMRSVSRSSGSAAEPLPGESPASESGTMVELGGRREGSATGRRGHTATVETAWADALTCRHSELKARLESRGCGTRRGGAGSQTAGGDRRGRRWSRCVCDGGGSGVHRCCSR